MCRGECLWCVCVCVLITLCLKSWPLLCWCRVCVTISHVPQHVVYSVLFLGYGQAGVWTYLTLHLIFFKSKRSKLLSTDTYARIQFFSTQIWGSNIVVTFYCMCRTFFSKTRRRSCSLSFKSICPQWLSNHRQRLSVSPSGQFYLYNMFQGNSSLANPTPPLL